MQRDDVMQGDTFTRIVRDARFRDEGHGYDVFGLHPPSLARVAMAARPLYERYFRVDSIGSGRIPGAGPVIVVANHAGFLPMDAAVLVLDLVCRLEPPRIPRVVADHFVPRLPLVSTLFARVGVVNGTPANVRHLLRNGELVVSFPEGVTGMGKPFRDRYRLQSWRPGFADLAIRHQAPIVPVAIIGSEESWPVIGRLRNIHPFGAPFLPIPAMPIPLPAHYHLRYGSPIAPVHDVRAAENPRVVEELAGETREALENLISDARDARRGIFR